MPRPAISAAIQSIIGAATSGLAAFEKLGLRPCRASPSSVNWETKQDRAADVQNGAVHLARVIFEHAKPDELFHAVAHVLVGIAVLDACKREEAPADLTDGLARHGHLRAGDALHHQPHLRAYPEHFDDVRTLLERLDDALQLLGVFKAQGYIDHGVPALVHPRRQRHD